MLSIFQKFKSIKSCIFVLQLALLSSSFVFAQDQAPEQTEEQAGEQAFDFSQGMPDLGQMFSQILNPEMLKGLASQELEEEDAAFEKKQQMLESLPQETRELCDSAEKLYLDFLRKISIKNGLQDICANITKKLNELADKKQNPEIANSVTIVVSLLDKFEKALFAGSFVQIPQAMPVVGFEEMLKKLTEKLQKPNPEAAAPDQVKVEDKSQDEQVSVGQEAKEIIKFEENDFKELFEALNDLLPVIRDTKDIELISDVVSFRNIATSLRIDDQLETMKRYVKYVAPYQKKAYDAISSLRKAFVQKIREIRKEVQDRNVAGMSSESETIQLKKDAKSYIYWRGELSGYLGYLNKFESLKNSSSSIFSDKEGLFNAAGYLYDLSLSFLKCYKRGLKLDSYSPEHVDQLKAFANKMTNPNWLLVKSYEWGAAGLFAYWTYKSQNVGMARPQMISHVLNGKSFGQAKSNNPLEMLVPLLSGGAAGAGEMGGQLGLLSMMSGMMGPGQEKVLNRILFFMAFMSAVSPKGLSQDYPRLGIFNPLVGILRDIFVAVIYDNLKLNFDTYKSAKDKKEAFKPALSPWPKGMPALKGQVFYLGQHLSWIGGDLICDRIDKWFPTFWAKSNRFSLGILSPDLIKSFMIKLYPIWVYSKNPRPEIANFAEESRLMKIANLDPRDIDSHAKEVNLLSYNLQNSIFCSATERLNFNDGDETKSNLFDASVELLGESIGENKSTTDRYCRLKRNGHHVGSFEWYCIESFFVSYIFSCVGARMGQFIAKKYNKSLCNTAYKVMDYSIDKILSLCSKVHLIDDEERESWNEAKEEVEEMFDSVPELIDGLLDELADPMSMIRSMLITALVSYKVINIEGVDQQSPEFQEQLNTQVVYFILSLLVNKISVLSLTEAYELMRVYVSSTKHKKWLEQYRQVLIENVQSSGKDAINVEKIVADLKSIDESLAIEFNRIFALKPSEFDGQLYALKKLQELVHQTKCKFSKEFAEKLKINLFASVMGKAVIGPIFNQTVGNWIRDKGTVLDGALWTKDKAGSAAGWMAGKFMSKVPGMPF